MLRPQEEKILKLKTVVIPPRDPNEIWDETVRLLREITQKEESEEGEDEIYTISSEVFDAIQKFFYFESIRYEKVKDAAFFVRKDTRQAIALTTDNRLLLVNLPEES